MSELTVMKMLPEQIEQVADIDKACFSSAWSAESISQDLENGMNHYFVAMLDGTVIGFAVLNAVIDQGDLDRIAVLPEYRRRGVAENLLFAVLNECRRLELAAIFLEVRKSNAAAISLYRKCGFSAIGSRKNYYTLPTEDSVTMVLMYNESNLKG